MKPRRGELDPVEQAGRESFPASDPPSWTLGTEAAARENGDALQGPPRCVSGVFEDETSAEKAVYGLTQIGFDRTRDIVVVSRGVRGKAIVPHRYRTGAGPGVRIGVLAGALIGGLFGLLVEYGLELEGIALVGPLRAIVAGAALGILAGYLVGVLGGIGVFWTAESAFDEVDARGGVVRVEVRASSDERAHAAMAVLGEAGAGRVQDRSAPPVQDTASDSDGRGAGGAGRWKPA